MPGLPAPGCARSKESQLQSKHTRFDPSKIKKPACWWQRQNAIANFRPAARTIRIGVANRKRSPPYECCMALNVEIKARARDFLYQRKRAETLAEQPPQCL